MSHVLSLRGTGQPIAYFPKLGKYLGCIKAGVFLGQMVFWSDKTDNPLGVYKTSEEIEEETGLSYREQVSARKKLVSLGLLSETYKRLDHRMYFKFNEIRFDEWLSEVILANQQSVSSPTDESAVREQHICQFVTTENTTEITTDISLSSDEQKSNDLDSRFEIDLNTANTRLKIRGLREITQTELSSLLDSMYLEYGHRGQMVKNQVLGKLVQWVERKQITPLNTKNQSPRSNPVPNRNVNAAWANQPQFSGQAGHTEIPEDFA